jgi:hypothetical protein
MLAGTSVLADRLKSMYFDFGFRYYLAGRFAAVECINPVAANLLHHAVAMFLKSGLCAHMSEDDRENLGNNLERIWYAFKVRHGFAESLDHFDRVVSALHEFEKIARPERIAQKAPLLIDEILIDEIETLIKVIGSVTKINNGAKDLIELG